MKRISFVAALAALIVAGCASYQPPANYTGEKEQEFDRSYDEVWDDLVAWFANNNISIRNIDKASGLIATDHSLGSSSEHVDCGTPGSMGTLLDRTVTINVLVRPTEAEGTRVRANVFGTGRVSYPSMSGGAPSVSSVECASRGVMERAIFAAAAGR